MKKKKQTNKQKTKQTIQIYNKFKSIINAVLSIRRYDKMIARSITYSIKG